MRYVLLTCKNHTNLRWSTKECAVSNGKYNGTRNIFFMGILCVKKDGSPMMYWDLSGAACTDIVPIRDETGSVKDYEVIEECDCKADCLVVAPEDELVKRD